MKSATFLAAGLCLTLAACSDEPPESAMREAVTNVMMASYKIHVAGMALIGSRPPPEPMLTAFKSHGCKPAIGVPGHVCQMSVAINGVDRGVSTGRFFKQADGTLAIADR
ncbi:MULTISPECIES: hypothetical protein [Methylorubrum]|uniref:hypothetical protein n=1 Tax=Methylorubrum TaxID=2282523 RepID=UPI0014779835|nr:hypothetical protein [Methylorubrum extorquens]MDF9863906.1 hypothetical protein [Methylorubrum pseudosasae]MDH6637500.1 hypothetical protein [Methylobacterium sp. SuP10 SLI 274]MDH6666679.1 hypothetical protein [Methylorubrum zatmanii]MCP1538186.1 hypothetical protein [Methylorubrum extorquens]MCP1558589.1 hypothetical protein [Methylorubrum extorquens]